ncbi:MAG: hypothetical protein SV253_02250 [Halobacteria archaeon]|nr:hypothetical protein [Halobacteria archaeon]
MTLKEIDVGGEKRRVLVTGFRYGIDDLLEDAEELLGSEVGFVEFVEAVVAETSRAGADIDVDVTANGDVYTVEASVEGSVYSSESSSEAEAFDAVVRGFEENGMAWKPRYDGVLALNEYLRQRGYAVEGGWEVDGDTAYAVVEKSEKTRDELPYEQWDWRLGYNDNPMASEEVENLTRTPVETPEGEFWVATSSSPRFSEETEAEAERKTKTEFDGVEIYERKLNLTGDSLDLELVFFSVHEPNEDVPVESEYDPDETSELRIEAGETVILVFPDGEIVGLGNSERSEEYVEKLGEMVIEVCEVDEEVSVSGSVEDARHVRIRPR